ncbi:MAG: tRNA dihydrouridine synthase DusB [Patescibacteria group bacterium]
MFSWKTAGKPIVALSPMADMTDSEFCLIAKRFGARIVFREMVSSEAVVRGNEKTLDMAAFEEEERPIIQQIFGADPDVMAESARVIEEKFHPDGIDINMGCPVYKITSNFNGAALMKDAKLAGDIIRKMKSAITVPLSVKIRLGWSDPRECLEFAPALEQAGADLLTVHGRTKAQGYSGVADWQMVGEVKKRVSIPVLVNGDIHSPETAKPAMEASGADGTLIARGALGNPWILKQIEEVLKDGRVSTVIDEETRRTTVIDHTKLMIAKYGPERGVVLMRKHYAWYFKGSPNSKDIRMALNKAASLPEVEAILALERQPECA